MVPAPTPRQLTRGPVPSEERNELRPRRPQSRGARLHELTYHSNALTFEELDAAIKYAQDLYRRWALVEDWGVVDQDGQVLAVKPS